MAQRIKNSPGRRRIGEFSRVLGRNIRSLRLAAALTLEDIAEHLGVTYQQVQKYENGQSRLPLEFLPRLCDALGVPTEVLLSGAGTVGRTGCSDLTRVQLCIARVADQGLRQKIVGVVEILSA